MQYIQATYRVRLADSGAICDGITGRKLANGETPTFTVGTTRIVRLKVGLYLIRNETHAHTFAFDHGRWYGGKLDHAAQGPHAQENAAAD